MAHDTDDAYWTHDQRPSVMVFFFHHDAPVQAACCLCRLVQHVAAAAAADYACRLRDAKQSNPPPPPASRRPLPPGCQKGFNHLCRPAVPVCRLASPLLPAAAADHDYRLRNANPHHQPSRAPRLMTPLCKILVACVIMCGPMLGVIGAALMFGKPNDKSLVAHGTEIRKASASVSWPVVYNIHITYLTYTAQLMHDVERVGHVWNYIYYRCRSLLLELRRNSCRGLWVFFLSHCCFILTAVLHTTEQTG